MAAHVIGLESPSLHRSDDLRFEEAAHHFKGRMFDLHIIIQEDEELSPDSFNEPLSILAPKGTELGQYPIDGEASFDHRQEWFAWRLSGPTGDTDI